MRNNINVILNILLLYITCTFVHAGPTNSKGTCKQQDIFFSTNYCLPGEQSIRPLKTIDKTNASKNIYILYDINPVEGFNLRRDVYVRLAVFLKYIRARHGYEHTKLVLPPFQRLYHWKTSEIEQSQLFWNHFFDVDSMKKYTAVLDTWEYLNEVREISGDKPNDVLNIKHLFKLKNYQNMFDDNGKFTEKFNVEPFQANQKVLPKYGYSNWTINQQHLISFQGNVMMLHKLMEKFNISQLQKPISIIIDHAEVVLHDHWGNVEFWKARRSMRFSKHLTAIANEYRQSQFQSNDQMDLVQRPDDWRRERPYRKAVGGNYLCAHLRRADFLYGRENTTPSLRSAAIQISNALKELNLTNVFISSDCSRVEFKDLKSFLPRIRVFRFRPESEEQKNRLKDGGIAIVDQIICSHARHFIGTFESTFTYRIYEEREILGFPQSATFNTLCKTPGDDARNCQKNSIWPIEFDRLIPN